MISAIAILAGILHTDAQCKIPLYVQTSTIPFSHKEQFYLSLKDAIQFWNSKTKELGFELVGDTRYDANSNATTISWSSDKGAAPTSIANTYLLYDGFYIKRARINLLYQTDWCDAGDNRDFCFDMTNSLEHELGHALGLLHTENSNDMMKSSADHASVAVHELSDNDKERFKKILSKDPCKGTSTTFIWR